MGKIDRTLLLGSFQNTSLEALHARNLELWPFVHPLGRVKLHSLGQLKFHLRYQYIVLWYLQCMVF